MPNIIPANTAGVCVKPTSKASNTHMAIKS